MKRCKGCGVELQIDNENNVGYCKNLEQDLCQRCFKIIHSNQLPDVNLDDIDFREMLQQVGKTNKLIIWVIDVFDFDGSYITDIENYINKNKVILVGNKIDLLPKSIGERKIKDWFIDSIDDDINVVDVILTSSKKKFNVDKLLNLIDEFSTGDVYIIGATNVGKSSLVNSIIKSIYPNRKDLVTTSYYAGTTLSTIEIPIDEKTTLIDTPGIVNPYQVTKYLGTKSLKMAIPNGEVRQKVFQLNSEQTLFISGLFRIDFTSGECSSFSVFVSNNIDIHRTKLSNADAFFEKHITYPPLTPPFADEIDNIPNFETHKFNLSENRHSIGLGGLGYVNIVAKSDIEIVIHAPKGVKVNLRKNMK